MTDPTRLDEEWAALRSGLSKAYTARDIDAALATARPRIESAVTRLDQPAAPAEGLNVERLRKANTLDTLWHAWLVLTGSNGFIEGKAALLAALAVTPEDPTNHPTAAPAEGPHASSPPNHPDDSHLGLADRMDTDRDRELVRIAVRNAALEADHG